MYFEVVKWIGAILGAINALLGIVKSIMELHQKSNPPSQR